MLSTSVPIIVAFITGVLGPVILILIKYYYEKGKNKPDMVTETLELSQRIVAKLEHIKEEYNADRVWITQFHNGGHFYPTGKSIAKFSIVYETVGTNVSSIQGNYQNIPVSLFSKSINHLLEFDTISIADFKDEATATYGLKYIAEESNTKSGYLFAIKTLDDKFIGYLGIDFTKKKTKLDPEEVCHLNNLATGIGGELSVHLKKII